VNLASVTQWQQQEHGSLDARLQSMEQTRQQQSDGALDARLQ
jgi:hypothetical protein